ncbi:MAG TPA: monovalent cation/H(+) antiporter subunit G [Gaiellaceae bacterium]|nr:monovalent cation/H(+) antiporter subunit G [Gaiellaceae bacterium]
MVVAVDGQGWAVYVLLSLGVACAFVCIAGVVVMRTTEDRLHYAAAGTTLPAFFVLAAVIVREHVSSAGLEAIAAVSLMLLLNPVLLSATARAIRRIDYGDLTAEQDEIEAAEE